MSVSNLAGRAAVLGKVLHKEIETLNRRELEGREKELA
jgi:hypothetical protein